MDVRSEVVATLGVYARAKDVPEYKNMQQEAADGYRRSSGLSLAFRLTLCGTEEFSRYRVLCKVQLEEPGLGRNPGKMRNFLSGSIPSGSSSEISVTIKDYRSIWGCRSTRTSCICGTFCCIRLVQIKRRKKPEMLLLASVKDDDIFLPLS